MFKRNPLLISLCSFSIGLFALDVPIIFVHGQKSEAVPLKWDKDEQQYIGGWTTWYPMNLDGPLKHPTAMTRIIGYKGYQYGLKADGGPAITCDINTESSSKSDDLWIPLGLYDEPSCIGCCLFSFGAGLVGYEIYKSFKDTTKRGYYPKFSIGISYSPGIAYRGVLSRLLESGEMDPFHQFYWNNQTHVDLSIPIGTASFVKLSGAYIWAKIEKTGTLFTPLDGHFCAGENRWEFRSRSFAISLGHYLKDIQIEAEIGYYVWDGQDHEIKAYTFEPVKIKDWGNGIYGSVSMGINKVITDCLIWNINLSVRYSKGSEGGYSSSEAVERLTPIEFHLTGFYIDFGAKYIFKKVQNGGAK